jgi:hypothetical protein
MVQIILEQVISPLMHAVYAMIIMIMIVRWTVLVILVDLENWMNAVYVMV